MKLDPKYATQQITFAFEGLDSITFDANKCAANLRAHAEMHGWEQRLRDNAAINRKQKDGSVITVTEAMRREAVLELVTHYEGGATEWNVKGGTRAPVQNAAILALANALQITYTEAEAKINAMAIQGMVEQD